MSIQIKALHSPDIINVRKWEPDDPLKVRFQLEIEIGPEGSDAADIFQLTVATPLGLIDKETGREARIITSRATVIMNVFSFRSLHDWLKKTISECDRPTWPESTVELQRYFLWEYENYKPAR